MSQTTSRPPETGSRPPAGAIDALLGRLAAAWVGRAQRHAGAVILVFLVASAGLGAYAAATLGINSSESDIFSKDLRVMKLRAAYFENFPELRDPIVVVVDAVTPDLAHDGASELAARLRARPELFPEVYQPDGGAFFDEHGLLYLSPEELQEMTDRLALAQPFLARLSRDQSIGGLFGMLDQAGSAVASGQIEETMLTDTLAAVGGAIDGWLAGGGTPLSWQQLIDRKSSAKKRFRRFLLVRPVVDFSQVHPAEDSLLALEDEIARLALGGDGDLRVRMTGSFPLAYEESGHVREQATWAGLVSLILVTVILTAGFGSLRLVFCSMVTLIAGLLWTAGFAAVAVGHLNLISIAFGVLFIGLSIDFAIHLSVQYSDQIGEGLDTERALVGAASRVGGSLIVCAVTTAIAFLSFVPTDFIGVAELGLIAGIGMFIGLVTNFTLLPALIRLFARGARIRAFTTVPRWIGALFGVPIRHAKSVLVLTAVLAVAGMWLLPEIHFDTNPIRVRDPSTDSVQVFNEILQEGDAYPWNLSVVADDVQSASETARRLEALPAVRLALTISDFVPDDQDEKLTILDEAGIMLLPSLDDEPSVTETPGDRVIADIDALEATLSAIVSGDHDEKLQGAATELLDTIRRLRARLEGEANDEAMLKALRGVLFDSLPERLRLLRLSLQTGPVDLDSIPENLKHRMIGRDGRARIEVFPAENLTDQLALEQYVAAVESVDPDAFGEGRLVVDSGQVVIRSLQQALLTAGIAIMIILAVIWRNFLDAALVAVPLVLATILTVAGTVVLGIPFNFANVIIIPLLLGMGIDSGIHMVHRVRGGGLPDGNLLRTGTARAVLLSAVTTMASFGTLAFSTHLGIASLGKVLTMGILLVLVCNLIVLPALVRATDGLRGAGRSSA